MLQTERWSLLRPQSLKQGLSSTAAPEVPARLSYAVHLDALRSLAAFIVVAVHAQMLFFAGHAASLSAADSVSGARNNSRSIRPQGLGHHAVIVFFVLSGFLVGSSAWRAISSNRWSWTNYLLQRLTRLWIVLIPALLIGCCLDNVGLALCRHTSDLYNGTPGKGVGDIGLKALLANAAFLQTIWAPIYGSNAALWSLANEFWYYILFPVLLLALLGPGPAWIRIGYACLAACLLSMVGPRIALLFLVWLLGFVVSQLALKIPARYLRVAIGVSLVQFLVVNGLIRNRPIGMFRTDLYLSLSFALVLYAVLHDRQPSGSRIYQQIAGHLSKFSYTLYLVHLPFLTLFAGLLLGSRHGWNKDLFHMSVVFLLVVAAYVYAWLLYLAFERNTEKLRIRIKAVLSRAC